ncbi:MAG: MFS transporter [Candidatus Omnitrophica bacterium]|nr:MFS transporter [Candidatus Omnitrophota bacterium]
MFSSLKIRDFRLYWFGMFISLIGTWIQQIAQSWLVFSLTNSAFLLGVVGFLGTFPVFVLSLLGGVAADRFNKKSILLVTQISFMILAFVLAVLTHAKLINTIEIIIIAVLNGVIMAFDAPARQSVVVDLVGKKHLMNAIALNSAAFNSARIIGPAFAGVLIAGIGMSGCFYVNGISFLAVIIALLMIKTTIAEYRTKKNGVLDDLLECFSFIKTNRIILVLITMVAMTSLFGISYIILMPVFVKDVLHSGARGLGVLMSSAGIGALAAALLLARLGDFKYKGQLVFYSSIVFSAAIIFFSLSNTYLTSIISLIILGWSSVTAISLVNTLLQTLVPDHVRGRVMSLFMLTFAGIMPFGNLIAGFLAHAFGVSFAIMISGVICGVFFIALNLTYPQIREL